uniref:Uncharacterized protein n=1 Tax=Meloidogyne enterolobii TaxID=390850 RepID=A0A6V7X4N9_MELEN|nr:unnamed protein product [Meloidogyne enterolobii]
MVSGSTLHRASQQGWTQRALNLAFCAGGIIVCYGAFSFFQEKILIFSKFNKNFALIFGLFLLYFFIFVKAKRLARTKGYTIKTYGEKNEKFIFMQALVFFQCICNLLLATIVKNNGAKTAIIMDNVPSFMYSICSISYFLAMLFSNMALEWVNYPTQILGKSCKPIPIMLFGVFFAHKRYPLRKYFYVLLIVIGMAIFLYKPGKQVKHFEFGAGELLLCASLAMDGVTGAVQDRIRHYYTTDKWAMMFSMNAFSSAFLSLMLVVSGELIAFFNFLVAYPGALREILLFSVSGAVGQCFIFKTVTDFGPLTCSIVTTLRKLFSLVFSILLFSHPYTNRHILGTILVFAALLLDALDSRKNHQKEKEKNGGIGYKPIPVEEKRT